MIDIVEVLQHWHAGRPKSVVGSSLGIDNKTVRKYVAAAEQAGITPGGPTLGRAEWAELVAGWFPELVDARVRSRTFPVINDHHDRIKTMLETNTVATVHQRLRDEHGLAVGITAFRSYVAGEFPDEALRAKVKVPRPEGVPGDEAQIDYGYLGSWLDPIAGRARRVWAFVMVLAWSRHIFVRPVLSMNATSWVAAHVAAFEFFGGAPARLVPDNLANGVDRPDIYDPKINRAYGELAAHYGCLVDPARVRKPTDKPHVERPMPYVRDSFWRGRDWADVEAMQAGALAWSIRVAGVRHVRTIDGAQPYPLFVEDEQPALIGLPGQPFELASWSKPKVGPDCHIKVGKSLYSVPWKLIGSHVDARDNGFVIEVFSAGRLVKTWARVERGKQTDWADYPPEKVAFFMRTPAWCRRRAGELGPSVAAVVDVLLEVNALHRLRSAQGVIRLADKHPDRLDAACARALAVGDPSYRTVKGVLDAGTEHDQSALPAVVVDAPAHLHGPVRLFDLDGQEAS